MAVELIDLGNIGNNTDTFDMFWYGLRLPEKNAEKDMEWLCLLLILEVYLITLWLHSQFQIQKEKNFSITICHLETLVYRI